MNMKSAAIDWDDPLTFGDPDGISARLRQNG